MKNKILNIFLIIITLFTLYILLFSNTYLTEYDKSEISEKSPFTLKKQIFYSGILPKTTSYIDTDNWNLSISQYTDIAIYISTNSDKLTDSNTIRALYIDNINYKNLPNIGTPSLYYQNPLKFATNSIYSDYLIDNHLTYNILNFENTENYDYYSTPNFFIDCSLPITLKYINSDILKNYKISNTEPLNFNGKILKNSNISLDDLETTISFCINIVSNDNKLYKYNMNVDIPLTTSDYSILDQDVYVEQKLYTDFHK